MKKVIIYFVVGLLAIVSDLSIVSMMFNQTYFSILVPLVFFITIYFAREDALIFSLILGLVFDICTLQKGFFMTSFLFFEFLTINISRDRLINFSNPLAMFLGLTFFLVLKACLNLLFFWIGLFAWQELLHILLSNIVVSLLIAIIHYLYVKLGKERRVVYR